MFLLGHALFGHAMDTVIVVDVFECQVKCIGNKSCKSFNLHPDGNNVQRCICELNNKTRQMKPGDFKWKKGSTYYGSVQVGYFLVYTTFLFYKQNCVSLTMLIKQENFICLYFFGFILNQKIGEKLLSTIRTDR